MITQKITLIVETPALVPTEAFGHAVKERFLSNEAKIHSCEVQEVIAVSAMVSFDVAIDVMLTKDIVSDMDKLLPMIKGLATERLFTDQNVEPRIVNIEDAGTQKEIPLPDESLVA
jgi:hypothetical protein